MIKYTRQELEGMKMDELRKAGKEVGASDNNKQELIEEILRNQTGGTEAHNLMLDLDRVRGSVTDTYDLRDRIMAALKRLKEMGG